MAKVKNKIRIKMSDYIRAWNNRDRNWMYFHRFMAELKIGRYLEKNEQVHHIDGNIFNNNMNNLKVITVGEHLKIHKPIRRKIIKLCIIENCQNKHHAKGLCNKHYMARIIRG